MLKLTPLAALLLLCACAGSEDEAALRMNDLRIQAAPYVNHMRTECNYLIAPFVVRAGKSGFPSDLTVHKVHIIKSDASLWSADSSPGETGYLKTEISETDWISKARSSTGNPAPGYFIETVLFGIARGCGLRSIRVGDTVTIRVDLKAGDLSTQIETISVLTGAS